MITVMISQLKEGDPGCSFQACTMDHTTLSLLGWITVSHL